MGALTPRQERFVAEYTVDLNGTQAAIRAGYAAPSAHVTAARLLADAKVGAAVAEALTVAQERLAKDLGVTKERVVRELAARAYAHIGDVCEWKDGRVVVRDLDEIDPAVLPAIKRVKARTRSYIEGEGRQATPVTETEIEVEMHDGFGALKALAQHTGVLPVAGIIVNNDNRTQTMVIERLRDMSIDQLRELLGRQPVTVDREY